MDFKTKSDIRPRHIYRKREDLKFLKEKQKNEISKIKEKSKEKYTKRDKESLPKKSEEKKPEIKVISNNIIKNNKSINYFLSDTETTIGDTLNDTKKNMFTERQLPKKIYLLQLIILIIILFLIKNYK